MDVANTTSHGYDAKANLTSVTPQPAGRDLDRARHPLPPLSVTDGKGQTTRYSYDNMDRITQIL